MQIATVLYLQIRKKKKKTINVIVAVFCLNKAKNVSSYKSSATVLVRRPWFKLPADSSGTAK